MYAVTNLVPIILTLTRAFNILSWQNTLEAEAWVSNYMQWNPGMWSFIHALILVDTYCLKGPTGVQMSAGSN